MKNFINVLGIKVDIGITIMIMTDLLSDQQTNLLRLIYGKTNT